MKADLKPQRETVRLSRYDYRCRSEVRLKFRSAYSIRETATGWEVLTPAITQRKCVR